MHLAYIDDSGDQRSFALGAILVPAAQWLEVHDQIVAFRRGLAKRYGFQMRYELKATGLVHGEGPWMRLGVPKRTRLGIYKALLQLLAEQAPTLQVLGVAVPDIRDARIRGNPKEEGWDVLLERLERFASKSTPPTQILLSPDDGNPLLVRSLARKKRRFSYAPSAYGGDARAVPFRRLVDDPFHHDSRHSYLTQCADLVAYAAFRRCVPKADFPTNMWEELGDACLVHANRIYLARNPRSEPVALIVWPGTRVPRQITLTGGTAKG